jgi:hypothetical protein
MLLLEKMRQEQMGRAMSSGSKVAFVVMLFLLGNVSDVCQPRTRNMSARIPDCCLMLPTAP